MNKRIQVGDSFRIPCKGFHQTVSVTLIATDVRCKTSNEDVEPDTEYGWAGLASLASTTQNPASEQTYAGLLMVPPNSIVLVTVTGYQKNVESGVRIVVTKQQEKRPVETFSCYIDRSSLDGLLT